MGNLISACQLCNNPVYIEHEDELARRRAKAGKRPPLWSLQLDQLLQELFHLHDLRGDGFVDELELVKLNEKIAMLHHGKDIDRGALRRKYTELFREKLSPNGQPVTYPAFRTYIEEVLSQLDPNENAQKMIAEQFIAEAQSGRMLFHSNSFYSVSDEPFRPKISDEDQVLVRSCREASLESLLPHFEFAFGEKGRGGQYVH